MFTARQLEDLWDRHGTSVFTLARVLLCDETAAAQAVTLGMTDLARSAGSASTNDAHRSWARHVYWRSQELAGETTRTSLLVPPAMVWLGQLAELQRACLALCLFGGHNYREAAGLLGVPPRTVANSDVRPQRSAAIGCRRNRCSRMSKSRQSGSLALTFLLTRNISRRESP